MLCDSKRSFLSVLLLQFHILLILFAAIVSPGANDLHFEDGASTADIIGGDVFFEILDPPELRYTYRMRPARDFGATFNESFQLRKVKLVPTVPLHSCTDIENSELLLGQVALSERGECSFASKTSKAQQAGAIAIIITESLDKWDDAQDYLIEMVDDKMELNINIPAAFLPGRNGATILRTLKKLDMKYAIISLPINMTHVPFHKMNQPPWIAW
ncbi:PRADC1-like protein [Aricia agestis]|uniref:PRADC1-like protein n=1 Tax=Aricia agestis TaxID=91739 RepID=UPI001C206AEA|nr:PRADC1-like protein [Aricia agestis]